MFPASYVGFLENQVTGTNCSIAAPRSGKMLNINKFPNNWYSKSEGLSSRGSG